MTRIVSISLPHWPIERLARQRTLHPAPSSTSHAVGPPDRGLRPPATREPQPFALVESGRRGVRLSAVNAAASQHAIAAGDGLADARAILPSLAVAKADPARDKADLRRLARWTGRYGLTRNAYGYPAPSASGHPIRCYGLWIDIAGVAHLYGGEAALLEDLERRLTGFGLTARAGLADTLGAAHALAWFQPAPTPAARIAQPGESAAAIAHLPVAALRLDASVVQVLRRLGLKQIGALSALPRDTLARRFRARAEGHQVLLRLDQALGRTSEPRHPLNEPAVLACETRFAEPLVTATATEHETRALVATFCARLEAAGLGVRTARLSLYRSDGGVAEVGVGTSAPTRQARHLTGLILEKLTTLDLGLGVDLLTLEAVEAEPLALTQESMAHGQTHAAPELAAELIDRLVNRLGEAHVLQLAPHASHWPERAQRTVAARANAASQHAWPDRQGARAPRLAFLLDPPEPIAVIAAVPEGAPARFIWRRITHRIVRAAGPERIEPEWWRTPGRPGDPMRDYYMLEDEDGGRFWVFRAGRYDGQDTGEDTAANGSRSPPAGPRWFIHGL
jgi:protein ImuB